MRLLMQAYSGVAGAPSWIYNDVLRMLVHNHLYLPSLLQLLPLSMSPPKVPVVFRGPVNPNAKSGPSKQPKCVSTGLFAIHEFQESSKNLKCHAYPRGKGRCNRKCTPSQLELQRASEVMHGQALPYSLKDAIAASHALLCPLHWEKTIYSATLYLDLVLCQPPHEIDTPTTSTPDQALQLILAPRPPDNRHPHEDFLAFSCNELRRACETLDEEEEDETCESLVRVLPDDDLGMLVLRTESRLRAARERWESSPSSHTSWHGPAHLDYSVARAALAFGPESDFQCIAYELDERRCGQTPPPDELAAARDALGWDFSSYLPPQLLELAIPSLLCSEHRNAYWKHKYYLKWVPSLVDDEDPLLASSSISSEDQNWSLGLRRNSTNPTSRKDAFLLEGSTHSNGEMVLYSSSSRPAPPAPGNEMDKVESEQAVEPDDFVASCLTTPSIDDVGQPLSRSAPSDSKSRCRPRATSDVAAGPDRLSTPTPKPWFSESTLKPNRPASSSRTFDAKSLKATEFQFGFQSPPAMPRVHLKVENNMSSASSKSESRFQRSTSVPEQRDAPAKPSTPSLFRPEPYRTTCRSFDDDACAALLADETDLLRDLERIQQGLGVVPSSVKAFCTTQRLGSKLEAKHFSSPNMPGEMTWEAMQERVYEWRRVCDLRDAALECQRNQLFEAAWNAEVHSTVLRLALRRRREESGVWYQDVTTAPMLPTCLYPRPSSEDAAVVRTGGKKVDYAIVLEPSESLKTRIRDRVEHDIFGSINHTAQEHMRYQPIGISIETKLPGESKREADKQLLVWVSGHFTRLRQLLSTKQSQEIPALPLLLVQGHDWKLYVAKVGENPLERKLDLFQEMTIGSTASIVGIYTLLAALRRLAEWTEKRYRPWFVESVLD